MGVLKLHHIRASTQKIVHQNRIWLNTFQIITHFPQFSLR